MWFVFLLFVLFYWTTIIYSTFPFKKFTTRGVSCAKTCARFFNLKNTLTKRKQAQTYHSSGKKRKRLPSVVYSLCAFGGAKILLFGELSHISLREFAWVCVGFSEFPFGTPLCNVRISVWDRFPFGVLTKQRRTRRFGYIDKGLVWSDCLYVSSSMGSFFFF